MNKDIIEELMYLLDLYQGCHLGNILERAILEIEQLRRDKESVAADLYAGVRR